MAKETGSLMPPAHIRNAPTRLMKELGYGKGYKYDPDTEEGFSGQNYFPDGVERRVFYAPKGEGAEARIKERLERWAALARPERRRVSRPLTPDDVAFIRGLVIYEDAAILAFDKPAGLSSQGGRIAAATLDDLLAAFAKPNGKRPRLVHRLDRDTSGVILAAKTKPAAAFLGTALMGRRVKKTYLAIVAPGAPDPRDGRIEAPLRRVTIGREAHMEICAADHPDAESAVTGYRTLAAGDEAALMELRPAHRPHAPAARPPGLASAGRSPATPAMAAR